VTKNKLSDKPGNISNMDGSGTQVSKKHDSVITENGSKNVCVLTLGGKSENITVKACCNAAGQLLPRSNIQGSVDSSDHCESVDLLVQKPSGQLH